VTGLLDTVVVVDLLRSYPPAAAWLAGQSPEDFDWAIRQALRLRLSHNVGPMDCLIASSAHRLGLPLYSRNLKHFAPLLGNLARAPY